MTTPCARHFRRANDGPEVVRIGDAVAQNDERRFPPAGGQGQDVGNRSVPRRRRNGDNPLVRARGAHAVQLAAVTFLHRNPLFAGAVDDMPDRRRRPAGKKQLVQLPAGAQRLPNGVFSLEQVFPFCGFPFVSLIGCVNRPAAAAAARARVSFLFHRILLLSDE